MLVWRLSKAARSIFLVLCHTILGYLRCVTPAVFLRKKDLSNETVLITGAGSGIGRELAKHLSLYGCKLILWDNDAEGNEATRDMITGSSSAAVFTYTVDVTNRDLVYSTADKVRGEVGDVTILVNNAGIADQSFVLELADEHIEKCLQINTISNFWTVKAFLPAMIKKNHGHIVGIVSMLGLITVPTMSAYCSSKYGCIGFLEALDFELKVMKKDITVTRVCPGTVDTPLAKRSYHMRDGEEPFPIPPCTPEYLAEKIVDSIRTNEELLVCPRAIHAILFLNRFLPSKAYLLLLEMFSGGEQHVKLPKINRYRK